MIHLLSHTDAECRQLAPAQVQCISPYISPAHVLAPPRHWLEALVQGRYSWPLFRLRYKTLLRRRFREEPERFFALLDASTGARALYLTCHCRAGHCHGEIAAEFLENLRRREPRTPAGPRPVRRQPSRAASGARRGRPHRAEILQTLIEPPERPRAANE